MGLTNSDVETINKLIEQNNSTVSKTTIDTWVDIVSKQVACNENILSELIELNKGLSDVHSAIVVGNIREHLRKHLELDEEKINILRKLDYVYNDVSTPQGYLQRLSTQLSYLWIPLLLNFGAIVYLIVSILNIVSKATAGR